MPHECVSLFLFMQPFWFVRFRLLFIVVRLARNEKQTRRNCAPATRNNIIIADASFLFLFSSYFINSPNNRSRCAAQKAGFSFSLLFVKRNVFRAEEEAPASFYSVLFLFLARCVCVCAVCCPMAAPIMVDIDCSFFSLSSLSKTESRVTHIKRRDWERKKKKKKKVLCVHVGRGTRGGGGVI